MPASIRPFWRRLAGAPRERQAMAFLRIATGVFFLYVGLQKLNNPDFPALMADAVRTWINGHPQPVYQAFLETVILPNNAFFAQFVTWAELLIAASYLTGAFVRYSAILALALNINFLLATQHTGADALGINLAFLGIHATMLWAQAGRCYGLDTILSPWLSRKNKKAAAVSGRARKPGTRRLKSTGSASGGKTLRALPGGEKRPATIKNLVGKKNLNAAVEQAVKNAKAAPEKAQEKQVAPRPPLKKEREDPPLISPRIRDLRD
jgi:uncharacterized membrane protein YphA (DoxX/SURF4 family)